MFRTFEFLVYLSFRFLNGVRSFSLTMRLLLRAIRVEKVNAKLEGFVCLFNLAF